MMVEAKIHIERDDEEIELTVSGRYSPGDPGCTWRLPEDCWPPEPAEAEVEQILGPDGKPFVFLSKEEETAIFRKAEEALLDAGEDYEPDFDEPDPDDYYDDRE